MGRSGLTLLLLLLSSLVVAQDEPALERLAVHDLPGGSYFRSYAVVVTAPGPQLVVEAVSADGITGFYLFDYRDGELRARPVAAWSLPDTFRDVPVVRPVERSFRGAAAPYWPVRGHGPGPRGDEFVSAPSLAELRYIMSGGSPWPVSPSPDGPLAVHHLTVYGDGSVSGCLLEPNISAAVDRMTTTGAWWLDVFAEPHLVVGLSHETSLSEGALFLRLYSAAGHVVAQTAPHLPVLHDRPPDLVEADLTGDGLPELVFFSTAPGGHEPLAVYRVVRRSDGLRTIAFTLCSERMNGPDVEALQRALAARGFDLGPHGIDGWYGPDTRAAVIRFQREAGLAVTGVVGESEWRLLSAEVP